MYNPRFPHTLTVKRAKVDTEGNIVFDANGDPTYEVVPLALVSMVDGDPIQSDNGFVTTMVETINFGYRGNSRNVLRMGDVAVADWHIALPMFVTPLFDGDILWLTDYERTYMGEVVKKTTSNFGSDIWFNEVKN